MTSDKTTYQLLCSTANSDIAVSATVKPAAQTFASCSAPHPTLTATGTITSKNAGTVSYYWAMSDGEHTKPDKPTFTAGGTQAANALTFQAWVPATGNVVLVVTSPAVTASKPAAYKVTCGPGGRGKRAGGHPGFREIVGEPGCLDQGADVRRDLAGAGPDDQQPGPGAGADHFVPGAGDTNDGDPRAYAYDPHRDAAADAGCDSHAVTRKRWAGSGAGRCRR